MTKPLAGTKPILNHPFSHGLELCYLFNEKSGSKIFDVCKRVSGELNNFSFSSATSGWYASRYGGGLAFDGSNDSVSLSNNLLRFIDYTKKFSICFWFTFRSFSGTATYSLIGTTHQVASFFDQLEFDISSNKLRAIFTNVFSSANDGWIWDTTSTQGFVINRPYFAVWTYDGSNSSTAAKLYLDGIRKDLTVVANQGAINQSIWQSSSLASKDVWLGRRNYSTGDQSYPGILDQVRFYSRVLEDSEIRILNAKPFIGFATGNFIKSPLPTLDWTPHDPMGMLGIHGI